MPKRTLSIILFAATAVSAHAGLLGPTPYLSFADSPFAGQTFDSFHLETFEEHALTVPGVTADNGGVVSVVFGPNAHDSVDADDGVIDGSGLNGDDWFSGDGTTGVTWTFDATVLGHLPTSVGIVWTDGVNNIHFEAFDENGVSLGTLTGDHADGSFDGGTAEDRFYGAVNAGGISKIHLYDDPGGGIEMDHLQYGFQAVPEPSSLAFLGFGTLAVLRRRKA